MSNAGATVLTSLKNKMQHLRDDLEKYKDLYEEKCQELDLEKSKRTEVGVAPDLTVASSAIHISCKPV